MSFGNAPRRIGELTVVRRTATLGPFETFVARRDGPIGVARELALYALPRERDADARDELAREVRLCTRLIGSSVVRMSALVEDEQHLAIATELPPETCLSDLLESLDKQGERMPDAAAALILGAVANALAAGHSLVERGTKTPVLHRLVSARLVFAGDLGAVRLGGFALGKALERSPDAIVRLLRDVAGAAPPELLRGEPATDRTDAWLLGLLAYRLFTGKAETAWLFAGRSPNLASVRADLPRELTLAIDASLSDDPKRRSTSSSDMARRFALVGTPEEGKRALRAALEDGEHQVIDDGDLSDDPGGLQKPALQRLVMLGRPDASSSSIPRIEAMPPSRPTAPPIRRSATMIGIAAPPSSQRMSAAPPVRSMSPPPSSSRIKPPLPPSSRRPAALPAPLELDFDDLAVEQEEARDRTLQTGSGGAVEPVAAPDAAMAFEETLQTAIAVTSPDQTVQTGVALGSVEVPAARAPVVDLFAADPMAVGSPETLASAAAPALAPATSASIDEGAPAAEHPQAALVGDDEVSEVKPPPLVANAALADQALAPLVGDDEVSEEPPSPLPEAGRTADQALAPLVGDDEVSEEPPLPIVGDDEVPDTGGASQASVGSTTQRPQRGEPRGSRGLLVFAGVAVLGAALAVGTVVALRKSGGDATSHGASTHEPVGSGKPIASARPAESVAVRPGVGADPATSASAPPVASESAKPAESAPPVASESAKPAASAPPVASASAKPAASAEPVASAKPSAPPPVAGVLTPPLGKKLAPGFGWLVVHGPVGNTRVMIAGKMNAEPEQVFSNQCGKFPVMLARVDAAGHWRGWAAKGATAVVPCDGSVGEVTLVPEK